MRIAQRLYENGYITYMRTDSTTLSASAIARGTSRRPPSCTAPSTSTDTPRQYTRKVKNAQEAHEAIRPAGDVVRDPGPAAIPLDTDEFRLYELIWQRTVASQMADARGTTLTLRITGTAGTGEECTFAASGRTITFAGFLKAYVESVDEEAGGQSDDAESRLPVLEQGQAVTATELDPGRSHHQPARSLHRGAADQDARGAGNRSPVDVLVDHQDHPRPRLRLQAGQRAGARRGSRSP